MFTDDRQLKTLFLLVISIVVVLVTMLVAEISLLASVIIGSVGVCGFVIALYQAIMMAKEKK